MTMKPIKNLHGYLSRYVDDCLSHDEKAFVDAHLQSNSKLREVISSLRSISHILNKAFREIEPMNAVELRLQQFVNKLPQNAEHYPKRKWFSDWGGFFANHRKLQYAGICASILIMTILIVPGLIQPHLNSIYKVQSIQAEQDLALGDIVRQENRGQKGGAKRGIAAGVSLGEPIRRSKGIEKYDTDERFGARYSLGRPLSPNTKGSAFGLNNDTNALVFDSRSMDDDGDTVEEVQVSVDQPKKGGHAVIDVRKITRNADMQIEVIEIKDAQKKVEQIVTESGGTIAHLSTREDEDRPRAQYTLWIPSTKLDAVIESCKQLGKVQNLEVQIQDITDSYFDQETRIKNLQRQEERLLKLYERDTVKMEELLKVEKEIARVRIEVEKLQGRQRLWDRQIQFSTLSLNLLQKPKEKPIVESEAQDVFTPIRRAFQDSIAVVMFSCSLLATLAAWIFSFALFTVPWLILIAIIWYIIKRRMK